MKMSLKTVREDIGLAVSSLDGEKSDVKKEKNPDNLERESREKDEKGCENGGDLEDEERKKKAVRELCCKSSWQKAEEAEELENRIGAEADVHARNHNTSELFYRNRSSAENNLNPESSEAGDSFANDKSADDSSTDDNLPEELTAEKSADENPADDKSADENPTDDRAADNINPGRRRMIALTKRVVQMNLRNKIIQKFKVHEGKNTRELPVLMIRGSILEEISSKGSSATAVQETSISEYASPLSRRHSLNIINTTNAFNNSATHEDFDVANDNTVIVSDSTSNENRIILEDNDEVSSGAPEEPILIRNSNINGLFMRALRQGDMYKVVPSYLHCESLEEFQFSLDIIEAEDAESRPFAMCLFSKDSCFLRPLEYLSDSEVLPLILSRASIDQIMTPGQIKDPDFFFFLKSNGTLECLAHPNYLVSFERECIVARRNECRNITECNKIEFSQDAHELLCYDPLPANIPPPNVDNVIN